MKPSSYHQLLSRLCEHLGLQDTASLRGTGRLRIGGHDVLLQQDEAQNGSHVLQARVDMGPAAPDRREWIWYRLLQSNCEWGTNGILTWSLKPDGDHAILTAQHAFDDRTSGADFAAWLRSLVGGALTHWQALPSGQEVAELRSLAALARGALPAPAQAADWRSLMAAFCDHTGMAQRHALISGADSLLVDGVDMMLRHDRAACPGRFEIHINLGLELASTREQLWQGLLWNNFLMGSGGQMRFGVLPRPEVVVLTLRQDMPAQADVRELAEMLQGLAGLAKGFWEDTRTAIAHGRTAVRQAAAAKALKARRPSAGKAF